MAVVQTTGAMTAFASIITYAAIDGAVTPTPELLVIGLALRTPQTSWRVSSVTARAMALALSVCGEKVAGPSTPVSHLILATVGMMRSLMCVQIPFVQVEEILSAATTTTLRAK